MRIVENYARKRLAGFLLILSVGDTVFVRIALIVSVPFFCFARPVQAESSAGALFGAAAIAGAVSPAVVGGIQASTDRYLAGLDASTQMYLTDSNNRLSLSLGGMQMGTSLALAQMQMQTALYANSQVTTRQQMQLAAVERTNALNAAMQSQQMQTDYALKFASLRLQEQAMDWNYRAGVAQGGQQATFTMRSDGDGLSVRSYGLAASGASLAATTPLLTTTPGVSTQSAATNRLLSNVQGQPVVPATGLRSTRAVAPVRVPARALEPIQGRGVAPKPAPAREWARHTPARSGAEPAAEAPVVGGGHKNPGF